MPLSRIGRSTRFPFTVFFTIENEDRFAAKTPQSVKLLRPGCSRGPEIVRAPIPFALGKDRCRTLTSSPQTPIV